MTKKKNSNEKINAVEVWTAITGLKKEVKFTNENVKLLSINFSNLEEKIIRLNLNFKGMENLNTKVGDLEEALDKKVDKGAFYILISLLAILNGIAIYFKSIFGG